MELKRDDPVKMTLRELAEQSGSELRGDGDIMINAVSTIEAAQPGAITFISQSRYRQYLEQTRASAVILSPDYAMDTPLPKLVSSNPYLVYAKVANLLYPSRTPASGIHASAVVDSSADIAPSASIGPNVVIGARVRISRGVTVMANVSIDDDVTIGEDVRIYPNVSIYRNCVVGDRGIIHSGAVIGADGFGVAEDQGGWVKIPQIGGVRIGDDVEIGANTTIDRGALEDTVIEDGVKLDNQIQIGHNCHIGAHTAIAGCTGIAGSTRIGRYVRIGGAANISGHLQIADHVMISGASQVGKSISEPGVYTGYYPIDTHDRWKKSAVHLRQLGKLVDRVAALERRTDNKNGQGDE